MEARRDPRSFVFFIILLLIINSPGPEQQPFNTRNRYDDVLEREWSQLDLLNRTRYGDFDAKKNKWLNISGLRDEDGFDWESLGAVKRRAIEQTKGLLGQDAEFALDGSDDPGGGNNILVYRNVSGYVEGEWVRSSIGRVRHPSDMNLTATIADGPFPSSEFERNLTGNSGSIRVHVTELDGRSRTDENKTISELAARVVIGDDGSFGGNWFEFLLNGVHFTKTGGAVLTTTSDRFGGIFALPHFQLSQHLYSSSQELLNSTIHDTIERQINRVYPLWNPWTSAPEGANEALFTSPHCEFVLYLQQHPIASLPAMAKPDQSQTNQGFDIDWYENELRFPTGAPVSRNSPLAMSLIGFSPDCGFVIESKGPPDFPPGEFAHLVGTKTEGFNDRARRGIVAFAATLTLQLVLLIKQMKETATPSTRNRVSFYTIAMLGLGDGFGFLSLIFMHLFLGTAQLALYATAFMSLFSVVFELRFLMDIWTVQVTEQIRQDRQQASTTTPPNAPTPPPTAVDTPVPSTNPAPGGGLPLPATAPRRGASPPIIIAPDQDDPLDDPTTPTPAGANTNNNNNPGRAELGALYSRYCLSLIAIFFMTLQFTTMRTTARAFYFNTLCFLYLSFWCPQIYRNIMRNCRKALRWDFVLGQSAVRMIPIYYFYAVPDNVLFSSTDVRALLMLAAWVWLQILALASQEILGSRFFVREGWAPPAYDYHPILREDEEGATMPIGSDQTPSSPSTTTSSSKPGESKAGKGKKVFDCSICAQDIEVPVIPAGGASADDSTAGLTSGGLVLQRRAYMVTPCRHIFHTPCLEGWMRYRLQCPNCRETLPPL